MDKTKLNDSPLGQKTSYSGTYSSSFIFPISRHMNRESIGVPLALPFQGVDIWSGYELSWLNPKGKPVVAIGDFYVPCTSPNIFESKSFKLYLNSFNQTKFNSFDEVKQILIRDASHAVGSPVKVVLRGLENDADEVVATPFGQCLDHLDIEVDSYKIDPSFLKIDSSKEVQEELYSNLLKSNCLITAQPDWGTLLISYQGAQIDHEGLLRYIISFRNVNEFAEQCVERIFMDISKRCSPNKLSVYARYTRRGGLDINPFRSNYQSNPSNCRFARQ